MVLNQFYIALPLALQYNNNFHIELTILTRILPNNKWSLWYGDRNNIKIKKGVYVWKRTEAIEIEQKNDQYVLILVCIIGIFLILEGQGIILIKQVVNHSSITNKYKLFFSLGMSQKDRKKYFFHEIKNIAFYPMILGCVRGILLLGIIYFYQEGEFSKIFIYFFHVFLYSIFHNIY